MGVEAVAGSERHGSVSGHEDFEFFEPVLDDDHSRLGEIRPVRRENRSHLLSFRR